jgi:hypothetical protein
VVLSRGWEVICPQGTFGLGSSQELLVPRVKAEPLPSILRKVFVAKNYIPGTLESVPSWEPWVSSTGALSRTEGLQK